MSKGSRKNIGVLMSGGLDSAALVAFYLQKNYVVWPVFVKCGLRWEKAELFRAQKFLDSIATKKLRPLILVQLRLEGAYRSNWSNTGKTPGTHSSDSSVFLPARNILLVTKSLLALSQKSIFHLALGTLKGNPFPDGRRQYFKALEKVLSASFIREIKVNIPFRQYSKTQLIKKFSSYPLYLSMSCINPVRNLHCGKCNKCAERRSAFKNAGVVDRTKYLNSL